MAMRTDFVFSQASLQDYVDCKRRFYYRFKERLSWPAIEAEPILENEKRMIRGAQFHRLVQQYYLGVAEGALENAADAAQISRWWKNFIDFCPVERDKVVFNEKLIGLEFRSFRLVAKFDLISNNEDGVIRIFDWKTSRNRPKREFVAERMQTRIYPFVISNVAEKLFPGMETRPDKIEMVYWYAGYPDAPEVFRYSDEQKTEDESFLLEKINEINALDNRADFPLTEDLKRCQYCVYRSLCDRGEHAGNLENYDPEFESVEEEEIFINLNEIDQIEI
ncbi:MAG: PD-(D/E)XK nuclease family protein [Anaerolineales bacterium]